MKAVIILKNQGLPQPTDFVNVININADGNSLALPGAQTDDGLLAIPRPPRDFPEAIESAIVSLL